jgi:uroporphyrinogen III methyltransferase/synthase
MQTTSGKVFLIGAGPGDPGLITVRGRDCIAEADVVVYDYLAAPALLRHARPGAEMIYVGKKGGDHTLSQEGINALLVEKGKEGHTVARLKGGDPYIFGRGGEEAEALVDAGIPFEVVPGVTSGVAAAAYAGIPLTHRDHTTAVAFVTGHEDPTKPESTIDWPSLAKGVGTLVFFMGVGNLPKIVEKLVENGRDPDTPVALVRWGTTPKQVTVSGTLTDIVERVRVAGLKAPAITVVGGVAGLRERLGWFEKRPLLGRRIVVTRARHQASELVERLAALGADTLECPTIEVIPPSDWTELDRSLATLNAYDWVIFTSVNGVRFFFERLFETGRDVRAFCQVRTAAIGPATAERLKTFGLNTDILPESYRAESVVAAFEGVDLKNRRVLIPRAAEARPILPAELVQRGAVVDEIPVYHTIQARHGVDELHAGLAEGTVDMVTFTSSSTVRNFRALFPEDADPKEFMKGVTVASIGPITSDTARELGFSVDVEAESYTIPGLVSAVEAHFEQR